MNLTKPQYTFLDHTADLAVEVVASTPCDILLASMQAIEEVLKISSDDGPDDEKVTRDQKPFRIQLPGGINSETMVDALNEWLFHTADQGLRGRPDACRWTAEELILTWERPKWNPDQPLATEIKAVTYHEASLQSAGQESGQWNAYWIADL
ncbi:hypothetical protein GF324_01870 [bacterium]|nr:hypothetical protein [bacterium]